MDVSRIEAYNPNTIDWRKLTAKQIIKEENNGIQVPSEYINWARDFINSVYADDDTTYEMATTRNNLSPQEENNSTSNEKEQEPQITKAQQERKNMQENGDSLLKQGIYFRAQSKQLEGQSNSGISEVNTIGTQSDTETRKMNTHIDNVEKEMESILNNLNLIVDAAKSAKLEDNDDSMVEGAYEKGKQLDKKALEAHGVVSQAENKMYDIDATIESKQDIFEITADYGIETTEIGKELIKQGDIIFNIGVSVNEAGLSAVSTSNTGYIVKDINQTKNQTNLEIAKNQHDYITEKSGVDSPDKNTDEKKERKSHKKTPNISTSLTNQPKQIKKIIEKTDSEGDNDIVPTQELKKQMVNDGADEKAQTIYLREQSIQADNDVISNRGFSNIIAQMSQASADNLNNNIEELMNEINKTHQELLNEIQSLNSGNSKDNIAKINQLNEEIRALGMSTQSMISSTSGGINLYSTDINQLGGTFDFAIDIGTNAVQQGENLISTSEGRWLAFKLINQIIGRNTINTANKTIADGNIGITEQSRAAATINSNLAQIDSLQTEISSKTDLESVNAKQKSQENAILTPQINPQNETINIPTQIDNKPQKPHDPITGKINEADKDIKTSQNDGTDTTDKLNINIDEILKRKIRRGEIKMG